MPSAESICPPAKCGQTSPTATQFRVSSLYENKEPFWGYGPGGYNRNSGGT